MSSGDGGAALTGWYPDPTGDWAMRYWDGNSWSAHVANGAYQAEDHIDESGLPPSELNVWSEGRHFLTTHRIWIDDGYGKESVEEFKLWMVDPWRIDVGGVPGVASADIKVTISYPGYVGRNTWNMRKVGNPHGVGALIRKWANRNRREYLTEPV